MDLTKYKVGEVISWRVAVHSPDRAKVYYFYVPAAKRDNATRVVMEACILAREALPDHKWPEHAKIWDYAEIAGSLQCEQITKGNRKWKVARMTVSEKHGTTVSGRDC
jgi:hypothetical protein